MAPRTKKRTAVFASFDYDNDRFLKEALIQQSRRRDSPFSMADWSIKEESRTWRSEARSRIERADLVIVICGYQTHRATGVTKEMEIARAVGTPHVLLRGHKTGWVRRPKGTWPWETVHEWTWENLRRLTT